MSRTRLYEGLDRLAVLLIAAFALLRRLADDLIDASRPLLFEKWQSAPRQLETSIAANRKGELTNFDPICRFDILQDLIANKTAWFEALRQEDGLRDILIHQPHYISVSPAGSSAIKARLGSGELRPRSSENP